MSGVPGPDPEPGREFLAGGGEMGALIRAHDWSKTPVGAVENWSPTLRMMVSFLLANRFPLLLWWGPEYTQIYNDAYVPIPGTKHPKCLGQPASECWREIWHIIGPLIDTPFGGGPATWSEDLELVIRRAGFLEETHFTVAYSPVPDATAARGIGGVLATVHEITEKVLGERRIAALRDLGTSAAAAKTAEEACIAAVATLASHTNDIPFSLLYLIDAEARLARLAGAAGVAAGRDISPRVVDLAAGDVGGWPLGEAARGREAVVVENLGSRFAAAPAGPWLDPPHSAAVVPVRSNKVGELAALLVIGLSARLRFDDPYRGFLDLVAAQVGNAIANARAYEQERRRAEALAEIDRAKTAFFSNVSHEFRTPLTLMLGPLEDVLAAPPASLPQRREDLALVHRNSLRLLRLVNTLLDFSRIEAGRVQASYEPVDLASLTADLASAFRAAVERAGLSLRVECPPLAERVWIDRDMWEKIVLNLVSNAFKFTFEGEVAVSLRCDGRAVLLEVSDTGIGMPEEEIPHLFDRFHRIEGARGRTHEGSGIGLALVQELTRLHGGTVEARSASGTGSTFSVAIPLGNAHLPPDRLCAASALAPTTLGARPFVAEALRWLSNGDGFAAPGVEPPMPREPAKREKGEPRRETILFADDNADMRDYVRRVLGDRYDVRTVGDGAAAFAEIQARRPDLLLSDVMMPGLDGIGLVRRVRADPALADLPIVLLSARAGEEAGIEGLDSGADDYLVKPFSARELVARLRANLEMAQLRRATAERMAADLDAMRRLRQVSDHCIRDGNDIDECLREILDAAIAITGADKGDLQLLDPATGMLEIAAQRGFEAPFLDFFAHVSAGEASACGRALAAAERIVVEDVGDSEIFAGQPSLEILLEAAARAVQSTPLISAEGTAFGIISTHFGRPHRPSERDLHLMDLLARQTADYLARRQAEARSKSLSTELQQILDTSATGLVHGSRELRFVSANPAYAKIAGVPLDRILGYPIAEVMGQEAFAVVRPFIERVLLGERVEYEVELPWSARGPRWIHAVSTPYRESDGRISGWVSSVRDIAERKRAVARMLGQKRILEMVAVGAPLSDTIDALVRFIEAETPGTRCGLLLVAEDGRRFRGSGGSNLPEAYHLAMSGVSIAAPYFGPCSEAADRRTRVLVPDLARETRYAPEWRVLMLSQGLRAHLSIPIVGSKGNIVASLAFYCDMPRDSFPDDPDLIDVASQLAAIAIERDRAEQSLHSLAESLERQVEERTRALAAEMAERQKVEEMLHQAGRLEAIGRLTGGVAHDFNNLLTVIIGQADSIVEIAAGSEPVRNMALAARRAAERGAQLTGQLLAFSRHQDLQPADVTVQSMVHDINELVRRAVGETVAVEVSIAPDLWAAHIDPAQFEASILNLAVNARDAMPKGGHLRIRAHNDRLADPAASRLDLEPGDYVVVDVTDTGYGMSPEIRRRAFEPFFTTKDVGEGTGLGLAQVYGFAKQSGGTATIDSTGPAGTTIALYLPKAIGGADDAALMAEPDAPFDGQDRTVLVVEDQPAIREVIETCLDGLGFRVLTAADGPAARSLLESGETIDLLLTDVMMPNGVSGLELARDARRRRRDLKIVVVSGYLNLADDRVNGLRGLVFLQKPFRRAKLAAAVAAAFGHGAR